MKSQLIQTAGQREFREKLRVGAGGGNLARMCVCCPGTFLGDVCGLLKGLKDGLRKAVVFLGLFLKK